MKRTALVKDKKVVDVIMTAPGYKPPKGCDAVASETASIGDNYDGKDFTTPEQKHSKGELIHEAKNRFDKAIKIGVEFNLSDQDEPPEIVKIPCDMETRAEIEALLFVAKIDKKELSLVTRNRVFALTPTHILGIHEAMMRCVAEGHARLADIIRAIENGRITSIGEIDGL